MDPIIVTLVSTTLEALSREVRNKEAASSLKDLASSGDTNYAIYEPAWSAPEGDIEILPAPAVGKPGSSRICDGSLTIGGNVFAVTAFRLAPAEAEAEAPDAAGND